MGIEKSLTDLQLEKCDKTDRSYDELDFLILKLTIFF